MRSLRASPLLPVLLPLFLLQQQHQPSRAVHLRHARDAARPHGGAAAGGSGHILPTYMVHLYRNFKANASDAAEQDAERRADTVRSLMAKGLAHRHGLWAATFDLHALLSDKRIQAAELRIRLPPSAPNTSVAVYHHGPECQGASDICRETPQPVVLLGPSSLVSSSRSWRVFNMTSPLLAWLRQKSSLRVRRKQARRKAEAELPELGPPADRALLVIFSHTGSDRNPKAKASLLHTAERSKFLSPAESRRPVRWGGKRRRSKRGHGEQASAASEWRANESLCRRVDLHVDFNHIGWGSWIIFPKRYNAYRCEGSCPGPLGVHLNPTNHAYMQSLLKHYHPNRVASPCCAPTKMSPLSMLYYENGEMLLRHHEDMMVDECGCQ
ncbi:nodal-related 2 [Hippocampus zosterae]|uniref:nodal-related 2 n=1 Tax=Hippocampus zosterae TaxID=109293 RepID=UPI00223D08A7|nr:nodal-related 2 [Hippocampus zosterae]